MQNRFQFQNVIFKHGRNEYWSRAYLRYVAGSGDHGPGRRDDLMEHEWER